MVKEVVAQALGDPLCRLGCQLAADEGKRPLHQRQQHKAQGHQG